jgi:hypothetical protein
LTTRTGTQPENGSTAPQPASEGAALRRPYRAPRLRHLGSVRELTLGGSKGKTEGGGTFKNVTGKM